MKLKVVNVPSIQKPIQKSPGFAKKELADYKLDLMGLCSYGCSYCSSTAGNYLRMKREELADATAEQTGERTYPADDPALTFAWPDVEERLAAQLATKAPTWGAGKTLVLSQLTDAFSPLALSTGLTERAVRMVLERTSFRIRVLTKGAVVGTDKWIRLFADHPGRFVVGLSIGTLDNEWARKVEIGTSSPSARVEALHRLQDAGVPTFGMLCPVFPDVLLGEGVERLVAAMRPEKCETFWAEPYNDRNNWQAVRAGYSEGTYGWEFLTAVYRDGKRAQWSRYATDLYERIAIVGMRDGWIARFKYLLYEDWIAKSDAGRFAGMAGVLLQSKPAEREVNGKPVETGWSTNRAIRDAQRFEGDGYVGWRNGKRVAA